MAEQNNDYKNEMQIAISEYASKDTQYWFEGVYRDALKKCFDNNESSFSCSRDVSQGEFFKAACTCNNNLFEKARRDMAQIIHERVLKNGMFRFWDTYTTFSSITEKYEGRSCKFVFDYFGKDFDDYTQNGEFYEAKLVTEYQNHYSNSHKLYFDKKFEELDTSILRAEKRLKDCKQEIKDLEYSVKITNSIGACIGSSIWGLVKIAIHLGISIVVGLIAALLINAVSDLEWLAIVIAFIAGIICMVSLWIKYEVDMDFMDWGIRKDDKAKLASCRNKLAQYTRFAEEGAKTRASKEYEEAKARNEALREEDMRIAKEWQKAWYDYRRKNR